MMPISPIYKERLDIDFRSPVTVTMALDASMASERQVFFTVNRALDSTIL